MELQHENVDLIARLIAPLSIEVSINARLHSLEADYTLEDYPIFTMERGRSCPSKGWFTSTTCQGVKRWS